MSTKVSYTERLLEVLSEALGQSTTEIARGLLSVNIHSWDDLKKDVEHYNYTEGECAEVSLSG